MRRPVTFASIAAALAALIGSAAAEHAAPARASTSFSAGIIAVGDNRGVGPDGGLGSAWAFGPNYSARTFGYEYAPAPVYGLRPHRPRVIAPSPVAPRITAGAPRAWTARWYAYCADKYRSFDRRTGTYLTYGGERRLCR